MGQENRERVLIHAPYGRDAALICRVIEGAGIETGICRTVESLCSSIQETTEAALISDESLTRHNVSALVRVLDGQPPWSDLPLIVTTTGGDATEGSRRRLELLQPIGNVTLLERPLRAATLISAVKTAVRARHRQYQIRESFIERERLVRDLERSNEELAQFAHVVSHDLQEPIRTVKIFTELLAERYQGKLDPTADEFFRAIQEGASTMEALIATLLDYASVGQEAIGSKEVNLTGVVDTVLATLRTTIDEHRAEISFADLPSVGGNRVLLQQLFQNLVSNALKYHDPSRSPAVTIAAREADGYWIVSVKDNGQGIPAAYHETIFLPLKRLHGREISGTGMGLAVCRKIVERHSGRIWVESETGSGATFHVSLPKLRTNKDEIPEPLEPGVSSRQEV